jgi:hypothetical protein
MTLRSALQDFKETTLAAITGLLARLSYLASLRGAHGQYKHWGMETVHGQEAAERALKTAHAEVVTGILRTPIASLEKDLERSSRGSGLTAGTYVKKLGQRFDDLLPSVRKDSPTASHLSSVLLALSSLERHRGRATRSAS